MRTLVPALLLLLLVALPAAAQEDDPVAHVAARDTACPAGASMCFQLVSGSLEGLHAGQTYTITYENRGRVPHDLHVSALHDSDPDHSDTDAGAAFATLGPIPRGSQGSLTFTIPAGLHEIYLWCDVIGHERGGMWLEVPLVEGGGGPVRGALVAGEVERGSPMLGAWAAVALLALVASGRSRQQVNCPSPERQAARPTPTTARRSGGSPRPICGR